MQEKDYILLVEDDEDTRYILKRSLVKSNFEVITCKNGLEALDILDSIKPKVIIADWTMPEIDGLELCRMIKENPDKKLIYFIILTARSSIKDRVTGLDFGADDFLVKPVETPELLARIRSGIRIYNLQKELKEIEHKKALVEMACTIGHQINNPLTSLKLSLQSVVSDIDPKNISDDLLIIEQSIVKIKNLVDTLINIENPEIISYSDEKNMIKIDNKMET